MEFLTYIVENSGAIGSRTLEHIMLVLAALALAIPVGTGIGILLSRPFMRRLREPGFYVVSLSQTIPSLAILALAVGVLGVGALPAIIAIFLYILFPIARNTFAGLQSVPVATLDAARGMGMTSGQVLRLVELPLALPFLIAGIRTAAVYGISAGALAYLIGGGGLGDFIFTGINLFKPEAMLAGAIPTAILALGTDYGLERLGRKTRKA